MSRKRRIALPTRSRTPSQYYRFWSPMQETVAIVVPDDSGQGNDGTIGASNGAPWLTASGVTWGDGAEGTASGCIGFWNKDTVINYSSASGKTFLYHMRFQADAAPGANAFYAGNLTNTNTHSGVQIATANGQNNVGIQFSDGAAHAYGFGVCIFGTIADSTTYNLSFWLDGSGRQIYGYFGGVLSDGTWNSDFPANFTECTMDDVDFTIGAGSPTQAGGDIIVQDAHLLVLPSMPTNREEIAGLLANRPFVPLIDSEFNF